MATQISARILWELERHGLIKMQGKTLDEIHQNIEKAKEMIDRVLAAQPPTPAPEEPSR